MRFSSQYFQKIEISDELIEQYYENVLRDLKIAKTDKYNEVRFTYAYQALIKAGIVLVARVGSVKVRSIPGHHIRIIDAMAEILKDEDIKAIGHAIRKKRNMDLYSGGEFISKKEADDYVKWVIGVIKQVEGFLK